MRKRHNARSSAPFAYSYMAHHNACRECSAQFGDAAHAPLNVEAAATVSPQAKELVMRILTALLISLVFIANVNADEWPSRPVKIIVPFGAGGTADVFARLIADRLGRTFNGRFVVENVTGASGMFAAQRGSRAEPDGYTLTLNNVTTLTLVPALNANAGYDGVRDFTHIAYVVGAPLALTVGPSVPVKNIEEFTAYGKISRAPLTFGTVGVGSNAHIVGEAIGTTLGFKVSGVPYKTGNQSIIDTIAGRLTFALYTLDTLGPLIREGQLVPLASTSPRRIAGYDNLPTFQELGHPQLTNLTWFVLSGPAGPPHTLNGE